MTPATSRDDGTQSLLEVQGLTKHFPLDRGWLNRRPRTLKAVDGVSFRVRERETLSLVGESGCGKTTTARMILALETPTAGEVLYRGTSIYDRGRHVRGDYRQRVHAVFQDPSSSLDPRMRVERIVSEPLRVNGHVTKGESSRRVAALLAEVGLHARNAQQYPHEFSGGQRQRIALARALALQPSLLILDEPVSALDVSIRAQIMNLLKDLQASHGLAYVLISHNLATVRYLSTHLAVMYLGRIVEQGPSESVFSDPQHPYTRTLIRAALPGNPRQRVLAATRTATEVPSPLTVPRGCAFQARCPLAMPVCREQTPVLLEVRTAHSAACHAVSPLQTKVVGLSGSVGEVAGAPEHVAP